jgi:tetratricopeptide (TPR) repeat protein
MVVWYGPGVSDAGTPLFDPTAVLVRAGDISVDLRSPQVMIAVDGPPGSGRSTLVDRVAESVPDAVIVRVPVGEDADAPLHALLQAAAAVGKQAVAHAASQSSSELLLERFREVVHELARQARPLVLYLPDRFGLDDVDDDHPTKSWLERLAEIVRDVDRLPFALVVPRGTLRRFQNPAMFRKVHLPIATANVAALKDDGTWGGYAKHADRLYEQLTKEPSSPIGPLELRLMVGLVGLGVPVSAVHGCVLGPGPSALSALVRMYTSALRADQHATVLEGVRRLMLPREPLKPADAIALSGIPTEHEPLLRHCLGYGHQGLRVQPYVRSTLLRQLARVADEDVAHKRIADVHAKSDGALNAVDAAGKSQDSLRHWLEKVHHLAFAGELGAEDWAKQELNSREFLIDRARALSVDHGAYEEAAELYQRCLKWWPTDAYALHYRGYNLDRLGTDAAIVEKCFRAALAEERSNLYYNSRLVTFLIAQGRPLDADRAWKSALENVVAREPEPVAYHVTRHVVAAWLETGEVRRARAAFDTLPLPDEVPWAEPLLRLRHQLQDAEEAETLGVAVYPSRIPIGRRWSAPRLAQGSLEGAPRTAWFPGRVVSVDHESVVIAWVVPDSAPEKRRVVTREMSLEEWERLGGALPVEAPTFIELAEYAGRTSPVIFTDPAPATEIGPTSESEGPHPLRYLMTSIPGSVVA